MKKIEVGLVGAALAAIAGISAAPAEAEDLALGLIINNSLYVYDLAVQQGFEEAAREKGVKAVVLDGRGSSERQGYAIDDLMSQGIKGIGIIATDSIATEAMVDRADAAGVSVVAVAAHVGGAERPVSQPYENLSGLVMSDRTHTAELAAQMAMPYLPKDRTAKIAIIEGMPGVTLVLNYHQGFQGTLDKEGVDYEIVGSLPTDWTPEAGNAVCQDFLVANEQIDLIFSHADDMAMGCARALEAAGRDIPIVAVGGGSTFGAKAIQDGELAGSVCIRPRLEGRLTFEALYAAVTNPDTPKARWITYDTPIMTKDTLADCPADELW